MIKFTVRPVLWTQKKTAKGLSPLRICITIDRERTYQTTTYKLKSSQWDDVKKLIVNKEDENLHNAAIRKLISDIEAKITRMDLDGIPVTIRLLKGSDSKATYFKEFAKEIREDSKEINRIETFAGEKLLLTEITATFLRKYEKHERDRGMSQNTINLTFKYLRRIIRQAKAEKLIKENPFDEFRVPKYIQSERVYLVESERKKLIKFLDKPNEINGTAYNCLVYFLFGCYTGLRHSDWGRFKPEMSDGKLLKLRAKKNGKWVVLPVGPTLKDLLSRMKDLSPPISGQKFNDNLKIIGGVAKLKKPLTTHVARHSFATMCASNKIPQSVTAELLGVDSKTVRVYYHLTGESIIEQTQVLTLL